MDFARSTAATALAAARVVAAFGGAMEEGDRFEFSLRCAQPGRAARSSIFVRQQERGHAAVGLGDDPEAIVAGAWFGGIDRVNGEDAQGLG